MYSKSTLNWYTSKSGDPKMGGLCKMFNFAQNYRWNTVKHREKVIDSMHVEEKTCTLCS